MCIEIKSLDLPDGMVKVAVACPPVPAMLTASTATIYPVSLTASSSSWNVSLASDNDAPDDVL